MSLKPSALRALNQLSNGTLKPAISKPNAVPLDRANAIAQLNEITSSVQRSAPGKANKAMPKPKVNVKKQVTPYTGNEMAMMEHAARLPGGVQKSFYDSNQNLKGKVRTNTGAALQNNAFTYGALEGLGPLATKKQLEGYVGSIDAGGVEGTLPFMAGYGLGSVGQYAMTGGLAQGAVTSGLTKVLPRLGANRATRFATRRAADAITTTPLNVSDSLKFADNKEDFAKNLALNYGLDLAAGSAFDFAPAAFKYLKDYNAKLKGNTAGATPANPTLALPEPKMYVDKNGTASFDPNVNPVKSQAETGVNYNAAQGQPAQSGLKPFSEQEQINLSSHKGFVNGKDMTFEEFIQRAKTTKGSEQFYFGKVPDGLAADIKNVTGMDVQNYKICIRSDEVRHIIRSHGEASETLRGQIPVDDFKLSQVIKLFDQPDEIVPLSTNDAGGRIAFELRKQLDGYAVAVSGITNRRKAIQIDTYWIIDKKKPPLTPDAAKDPGQTSVTGYRPASSIDNISQGKPEIKDLGADKNKILNTAQENMDTYGAFPRGANATRNVDVPKATAYGDVQQHARTLQESSLVDDELHKYITEAINQGDFTKVTMRNKTALKNADAEIAKGVESARKRFDSVLESEKMPTSKDVALGYKLMAEYQQKKQYQEALAVAGDLSEIESAAGRTLQAARLAKLLTPEGRLKMVKRTGDRLGEKTGTKIEFSDDVLDAISKATTDKEIMEANKRAAIEMWNQVPATLMDKLNAWRYMSMLFNPKTHIRNIVGNSIFVPAREYKNIIGAGLERALIKSGERTKAILTFKDKDLLKFAHEDFQNVKEVLRGEGKYNDSFRPQDAKLYKNKLLEWVRKANSKALDLEDVWFMAAAYDSSLAQYMKANGLKPSDMTGITLERARNYAMDESLKATYRDLNTFANTINNLKRTWWDKGGVWRAGSLAIEGALPFTRTPMNILRRGVEYSPVGLVNGLVKLKKSLKTGEITAVEAIDNIAAGLSGTSIMALGALLGNLGIASGSSESAYNTKDGRYASMTGQQEYSLNFGDASYTVDWAAPISLPFFVGVELEKALKSEDAGFSQIVDSIMSISEPIFNISMLQGINNMVKTGYDKDAVFAVFENAAMSYAGQYVPTVSGQIARTIDSTKRSTVSTNESTTGSQTERFLNKQIAKIPFASQNLEPSIDLWGREETKATAGDYAKSAFENFLSPGYVGEKDATPVDAEIQRLYQSIGEDTVYPRPTTNYTITNDKVPYRMTEKELTQFQKTRGQSSYHGVETLMNSSDYKRASDEEKAKMVAKVYDAAYEEAKFELLQNKGVSDRDLYKGIIGDGKGKDNKIKVLTSAGIPPDDYQKVYTVVSNVTGDGKPLSASRAKKEVIDKMFTRYNKEKKEALYRVFEVSSKVW